MNKTAIKNFAVWARRKLIGEITDKARLLGVTETGVAEPLPQSTKDLQFFDIGTKNYAEVQGAEISQRNALVSAIKGKAKELSYQDAFQNVVEEIAYTWFNRMIAIRFMEVNDYLPSRARVLSSENPGKLEPDFVTTPFDTDLDFTSDEQEHVMQLKDENKLDELFRMLFIKQCNKLHKILPELFEATSDYTELLLTISFTDKDGVVYHLTHDISESDFDIEHTDEGGKISGQVEIIGWMYQYYNTEPKDQVFANLKKNIKISKENIPAATQLFTPDWIVRYMVENSLGRLWMEGHPNDTLKSGWKYYLEEAEQEPDGQTKLVKIREDYAKLTPEDIKIIDPSLYLNGGMCYSNAKDNLTAAIEKRNDELSVCLVDRLRDILRKHYTPSFDEIDVRYDRIFGVKPDDYGDYDIVFFSAETNELYLIEAKFMSDSWNNSGIITDYEKMFKKGGYYEHCRHRYDLVIQEADKIKAFIGASGIIDVHFLFLTSKPLEIEFQDEDKMVTFVCLSIFDKYIEGKLESEDGKEIVRPTRKI